MSGLKKIIKVAIAEKVVSAVWDKIANGKRTKGSMYPFRLPKESKNKQAAIRKKRAKHY